MYYSLGHESHFKLHLFLNYFVFIVAQIQEDIRDKNNDGHDDQGVDIPQLSVVDVLLVSSIVAGGVPLLHPGSGVVVSLGSHTL